MSCFAPTTVVKAHAQAANAVERSFTRCFDSKSMSATIYPDKASGTEWLLDIDHARRFRTFPRARVGHGDGFNLMMLCSVSCAAPARRWNLLK